MACTVGVDLRMGAGGRLSLHAFCGSGMSSRVNA